MKSFVVFLLIVVPLLASNFPAYLKKCKNDEHLNECFLKNAQAAVTLILKGDATFGMPSFFPLRANKTVMSINNLKMEVDNLKAYISPDVSVVEARWDTHNKNVFIKYKFSKVTWDSDESLEGSFLGQDVSGHGHAKRLYENGWFSYAFDYDIVEVNGANHGVMKNGKSEYGAEKVTFLYEEFTNGFTLDSFINKNWKQYEEAFNPQINILFVFPLTAEPFNIIFKITPMEKLFD